MFRLCLVITTFSAAVLLLAGCGAQEQLVGAQRGYLLTSEDLLATPGETVELSATLREGDFMRGQRGYVVRFIRNGELHAAAMTGDDGVAAVRLGPMESGYHHVCVELAPGGFARAPPDPLPLLVAVLPADTPIMVVDLDKTLVADGFEQVLLGQPEPMPDSPAVLNKLGERYRTVYLTHRPELLSQVSKRWLSLQGYPYGPLLVPGGGDLFAGSGTFKAEKLRQITRKFHNVRIGIGDRISDARVYHENGLRAILLIQPDRIPPEALPALADEMDQLPDEVQAVESWRQIEQAVIEGASFPPADMARRLRQLARQGSASSPAEGDRGSP